MKTFNKNALAALLPFLAIHSACGQLVVTEITEPSADRWNYVSNGTPGTRSQASTFSALPADGGVDDRFGQFLVKFDTAAVGIPAGLGAENYEIASVVFRAVVSNSGNIYDSTQDDIFTYGEMALPDSDPGRPLELHGAGFRNGFTPSTFLEDSPHGSGDGRSIRNAFAMGFDSTGTPRDVSNNIGEDFDPNTWAIGQAATLNPGDPIPADTVFTFSPDISDPAIAAYVREGLNQGFIWFTLSSLHPALMQGGELISYYTRDSVDHMIDGNLAPSISIAWEIPLRFTAFERDASGNVSLSFVGLPGFSYVIQASPDLKANSWEPLQTFSSPTATTFTLQEPSLAGKRFFRIARTPAAPAAP